MQIDTAQLTALAIEIAKILAAAVCILVFILLVVLYVVLKLRWVIARIQSRLGPNRTGPWGVLQTVADAIKLFQKEDIIPRGADRWLFTIAPAIVFIPAYVVYVVIPFGKGLTVRPLDVGVVYVTAISSISIIGIITAGWASNNKWSLLGAFRAASQLIAFEVPVILAMCIPVLLSGSLNLDVIVQKQAGSIRDWNLFNAFPMCQIACLMLLIAGLAEANTTPFDLMEAESELVAGFNTEYSGMKFALFFLAEFAEAFTLSALLVTLFLGGYNPPVHFLGGGLTGYWFSLVSLVWFLVKCWLVVVLILWIRSTFPRVRIDQLMNLSWKGLVPVGLANLLVTGAYVGLWVAR